MKLHLLDMGQTKYGDCLLLENNGRRILIDGAHPGDTNAIRSQLRKLFSSEPPFSVDLLIVTHCHSDHIGCLPDLIGLGQLTAVTALVADENLGFGRTSSGDVAADRAGSAVAKMLIPALQEEDFSDLPDEDLEQFIDDAATLESKYLRMLSRLETDGTRIFRYGRDFAIGDQTTSNELTDFEHDFSDFGLKILGPSLPHLFKCAEVISNASDIFPAGVDNALAGDDVVPITDLYRSLSQRIEQDVAAGLDRPGLGAAKNNQSIVIKVGDQQFSALLAADMQLAKAEVLGLNDLMKELLDEIKRQGPYHFVKLSHHASYNGFNERVQQALGETKMFAHTGGRRDASHPDEDVLALLESNASGLLFARTDRNGIITVSTDGGTPSMTVSRGRLNDYSPNTVSDEPVSSEIVMPLAVQGGQQVPIVPATMTQEFVKVTAKIPHGNTKVTLTIQVEKADKDGVVISSEKPPDQVPKRLLPGILFVTCLEKLSRNLGQTVTSQVMNYVSGNLGAQILDVGVNLNSPIQITNLIRDKLKVGNFEGVVLLGGYDIIPAQRLDVLNRSLRQELVRTNQLGGDADGFFVWSDDVYGDWDGDLLPELPVSRIPDGKDPVLLLNALAAQEFSSNSCFAIRNSARPFSDSVFNAIPGSRGAPNISELFESKDVKTNAAQGAVYYMLHGSDEDGSRFFGETQDGEMVVAFTARNVPSFVAGTIVFTGCCWGALTVTERADRSSDLSSFTSKEVEGSIALTYLRAGAIAFVGCTGSHYSPLHEPFDYYGRPMHDHFWREIRRGTKPSQALFAAKLAYLQKMPHRMKDAYSQAVELKILRQYTCLGLGW
ncbi:MBL fold metallo-hydrolase [Dyadobacter sp. CY327]|nr:MBL fold metallo-hydrolase [Dyadobacter sp. CY327]MCE7070887.1 MBL fold metallo-hydrolase [Dyadobacter sp. CY327]